MSLNQDGGLKIDRNPPQELLTSESDNPNIIGHGIEIVEISYIEELIEQSPKPFEMQYFTLRERDTARFTAHPIQYLAGRFVAKKAVFTALGQGWSQGISFLDIEVQRLPSGAPSVVLDGKCQKIAVTLGISKWLLSISHTSFYAIASAIAI